jgi:hypothetical protein
MPVGRPFQGMRCYVLDEGLRLVPPGSGGSWYQEITEGVRHLARTVVLRQLAVACALTMVAMGLAETVGLAVVDDGLGRPPPSWGAARRAVLPQIGGSGGDGVGGPRGGRIFLHTPVTAVGGSG